MYGHNYSLAEDISCSILPSHLLQTDRFYGYHNQHPQSPSAWTTRASSQFWEVACVCLYMQHRWHRLNNYFSTWFSTDWMSVPSQTWIYAANPINLLCKSKWNRCTVCSPGALEQERSDVAWPSISLLNSKQTQPFSTLKSNLLHILHWKKPGNPHSRYVLWPDM